MESGSQDPVNSWESIIVRELLSGKWLPTAEQVLPSSPGAHGPVASCSRPNASNHVARNVGDVAVGAWIEQMKYHIDKAKKDG